MIMKKVLALFMVLLPIALCAQVRVVSAPEDKTVAPYDSLHNFPSYQITGMVGQELFLPPKQESLKKYGYQSIYRTAESVIGSIPCDEIEGHTFKIVSVDKSGTSAFSYKLKLEDTQTGTNYYYSYSAGRSKWEFITLGYKAKYEAMNKGKSFVALTYSLTKDYTTGKYFTGSMRGSIWVFQEIVAKDDGDLGYLYTNSEGQTVVTEEYFNKDMKPKTEIDKLRRKYGSRLCDLAIDGKIKIGMPADLVIIAKGEPRIINKSSYGEQWVYGEYGDNCIYLKNGKVTDWN